MAGRWAACSTPCWRRAHHSNRPQSRFLRIMRVYLALFLLPLAPSRPLSLPFFFCCPPLALLCAHALFFARFSARTTREVARPPAGAGPTQGAAQGFLCEVAPHVARVNVLVARACGPDRVRGGARAGDSLAHFPGGLCHAAPPLSSCRRPDRQVRVWVHAEGEWCGCKQTGNAGAGVFVCMPALVRGGGGGRAGGGATRRAARATCRRKYRRGTACMGSLAPARALPCLSSFAATASRSLAPSSGFRLCFVSSLPLSREGFK